MRICIVITSMTSPSGVKTTARASPREGCHARSPVLGPPRLDHFEEEIRARMPARQEVKSLRLASGVPVIHLIRTAYDTEGRAVEVCDTVMAADAYALAYRLPAM